MPREDADQSFMSIDFTLGAHDFCWICWTWLVRSLSDCRTACINLCHTHTNLSV